MSNDIERIDWWHKERNLTLLERLRELDKKINLKLFCEKIKRQKDDKNNNKHNGS